MYYASGKKKHDRFFYMEGDCLSWDKKRKNPGKANKSFPLKGAKDAPAIKSAKEWFALIDADGSGAIDEQEFANLYKKARGEKLKKKELKAAMVEMDTDGSGEIELDEFESWWAQNGGDLEVKRHLALTVYAGDVELLLVAPDMLTKARWLDGLTAKLRELGILAPEPEPAPEPAPDPPAPAPAPAAPAPAAPVPAPAAPAPAPAAASEPASGVTATAKEIEAAKVNAIGDKIRELKKSKAEKSVVMAEVEKLKAAKVAYEKLVGEPFPAPQSDKQPKQNKQKEPKQQLPKKAKAKQAPEGRRGSPPSAVPAPSASIAGTYMPWAVAIKPQPAGSGTGKLWSLKITSEVGAYSPLPPTANVDSAEEKPSVKRGISASEASDGRWALSIGREGDRFALSLTPPSSESVPHTAVTVEQIVAAKEQKRIDKLVEITEKDEDKRIAKLVAEQKRAEQELEAERLQRLARLAGQQTAAAGMWPMILSENVSSSSSLWILNKQTANHVCVWCLRSWC